MRTKLALAALVAGVAATLAPAPASAVCIPQWQALTGMCNPCQAPEIVDRVTGRDLIQTQCLA